jgi:uncharacterized membrane protein
MARQLKIFLAGVLVVVPFAITVWVIWAVGLWLDDLGVNLALRPIWGLLRLDKWRDIDTIHGVGAVVLVVGIYLIGLLTHFWLFRKTLDLADAVFLRIPGVSTIYKSIRDLMLLFDSDSAGRMGSVVEYCEPDSQMAMLGILTNEQPEGSLDGKAAVYFPLAYMIGGPIAFVPREHLREVDMPVEQALRLCATAQVTKRSSGAEAPPSAPPGMEGKEK